jgi:hypothetical protein
MNRTDDYNRVRHIPHTGDHVPGPDFSQCPSCGAMVRGWRNTGGFVIDRCEHSHNECRTIQGMVIE